MDSKRKISIIGLGYVGLPLAVQFSKKYHVVGYDTDVNRILELKKGIDKTNELTNQDLKDLDNVNITSDKKNIVDSNIYIITVPTPVDKNNKPNLNPLIRASEMVGGYLSKNNIVVYESTVFPGCTEEVCVPVLEQKSGLKYNSQFFCGYSPERINPGDKEHTLTNITKIVSGSNNETLKIISHLYKDIIDAEIFNASSIMVAEAAKVIENTQRDVNIALMNELALIFDRLNIKTSEVLDAANTKWNFLPFKPGLVGGHCIGVDPYYLTHKALEMGYHPEIILAGRRINDNMGQFIVSKTVSELAKKEINPVNARISVLGITFKENCPDIRNTKVATVIQELEKFKSKVSVTDHLAIKKEVKNKLKIDLVDLKSIKNQDAIIIAVAHEKYFRLKKSDWNRMLKPGGVLIDIKSVIDKSKLNIKRFTYWEL